MASEAELRARPKFAVAVPASLGTYALVQFAPLIAATFFMLLWQYTAPKGLLLLAAGLVFWTLVALGALLDGKRWGVPLELARLVALAALGVTWRPAGTPVAPSTALAVACVAGFAAWLWMAARASTPSQRARRSRVPPSLGESGA